MTHLKPLFFIGNKRSGTSLLVQLLNLHPKIAITEESDIVWLLYQLRNGWPERFDRYPWDGIKGLLATLRSCEWMLQRDALKLSPAQIRQMFERLQCHLLTLRASQLNADGAKNLIWLGDKKPVQHCDPLIRPFLTQHFSDARYLHIIRHPAEVVASKMRAAETWAAGVPPYWCGTADEILERWTIHEEWVLEATDKDGLPVLSIRLEDLVQEPGKTITEIVEFLELSGPPRLTDIVAAVNVGAQTRQTSARLAYSARTKRIMTRYDYET